MFELSIYSGHNGLDISNFRRKITENGKMKWAENQIKKWTMVRNTDILNGIKHLLWSPFNIMGLIISKLAQAAPVPCPKTVTDDGLPPNAAMLSLIQIKAAVWSTKPKFVFTDELASVLVFKKPVNKGIHHETKEFIQSELIFM